MQEEQISREDLVEMFSSITQRHRQGILNDLERAIPETKSDAEALNNDHLRRSVSHLELMRDCCQQAEKEFQELAK